MYAQVTRVRTTDQSVGDSRILAEEMLDWLRQIDGFEGMLMVAREEAVIGMTFWRDREVAERHRAARMQFIERLVAVVNVEIEETLGWDVTFAELGPALAQVRAAS